jgi:hypothetical protein
MTVRANVAAIDYSLERTSAGFEMDEITAANFAAQNTAFIAVQTAFNGVSLLTFDGENYPARQLAAASIPVAKAAQREIKWRVKMTDAIDSLGDWSVEIGGADTSLLVANSDDMDLTAGAGLALKNAIEANCVSRLGNAVTVISATLVGRNT